MDTEYVYIYPDIYMYIQMFIVNYIHKLLVSPKELLYYKQYYQLMIHTNRKKW
jgi:hypothetical protein